jgi:hypothetical protein
MYLNRIDDIRLLQVILAKILEKLKSSRLGWLATGDDDRTDALPARCIGRLLDSTPNQKPEARQSS